ncbi:MAG: acetamidase/formamidase family protein [Cypionkella sp.]
MTVHRFSPQRYFNTIGPHAPELRIADGDSVVAATIDAHGYDADEARVGHDPNPMTGPFFIEGAAPGDTLAVTIDTIDMSRRQGWTRQGLAPNVVDPGKVASLPVREKILWDIDRNGQRVSLRSAPATLRSWSVPLEPMIGCLGVAPDGGQFISTATSGPYGGNMDYRGIRAGTTICFPVTEPGALFFLGDVHAAQGDGEIAGTGIETSAEVQFTVRVVKGKTQTWPRGETAAEIFTVGNARPLDQALQHATTEMLDWLLEDYGLDHIAASHVMAMAVRYDVANVYNPAYSVACRLAKSALPQDA